jgi:DNA-binding NarL/FixJ family response regulator
MPTSTPQSFTPISTNEMRGIAHALEIQAKSIRQRADNIDKSSMANMIGKSHLHALEKLGKAMANAAQHDKKRLECCAYAIAYEFNTSPETAIMWGKSEIDAHTARKRAARDREFVRLASLGHTNSEIAKTAQVSTRTVSKAISDSFRNQRARNASG